LGNRVGRQESELSTISQQSRRPQEEVGAQISATPLRTGELTHQIFPVRLPEVARDLLPAHERRIADKRIKTSPVDDNLGEFQRPVKRPLAVQSLHGRRL